MLESTAAYFQQLTRRAVVRQYARWDIRQETEFKQSYCRPCMETSDRTVQRLCRIINEENPTSCLNWRMRCAVKIAQTTRKLYAHDCMPFKMLLCIFISDILLQIVFRHVINYTKPTRNNCQACKTCRTGEKRRWELSLSWPFLVKSSDVSVAHTSLTFEAEMKAKTIQVIHKAMGAKRLSRFRGNES